MNPLQNNRIPSLAPRGRNVPILCLLVAVALVLAAPHADAHQFRNPSVGYVVDVPAGWEIAEAATPEVVSFVDPKGVAVFQVFSFAGERFATAEEIGHFISNQLGASGDAVPFVFNGREALFADLSFSSGEPRFRGYYVFLERPDVDYAVMAFAEESNYEAYHDFLLSTVDSFAADEAGRLTPGPVSQFYYAYPPPNPAPQRFSFEGTELSLQLDPEETEATQLLIEREARILTAYGVERWGEGGDWVEAWKRFYRVIYRDNVDRLAGLASSLEDYFRAKGVPRSEIPARLLAWLQDFDYSRTGTLSDLLSPTTCLVNGTGDCDALGLVYVIILHHLDFDAILLVSHQYAHALAGVVVEGSGARYEHNGKSYLLAEFTADVAMGMIPRSMADPAGWIPVEMMF